MRAAFLDRPFSSPSKLAMAATDVIIPPPEIKAIVDKTADFVAKHGPALEQKILGREAGVKKFEFLLATSVYHAYYRAKVTECSGGAAAVAPAPTVAEVAQENVARRVSATAGMISKAADVKEVAPKRALSEPPKDSFIADYPDGIIINGCAPAPIPALHSRNTLSDATWTSSK